MPDVTRPTTAKPTILAVDDDLGVLRAVERDLRAHYGKDYRILTADSGAAALSTLRQLVARGNALALLLVDQRMPAMTGVEFLVQAIDIFPDAKRVLLTAYADTAVAIRAVNEVRLDHYLLKPWDPPEERLYPVLDDFLADWQADYHPPFEGVRVVGHRWSPQAHAVRQFLARNQVPYQWVDVETDSQASVLLAAAGGEAGSLPLVVFPDGSHLAQPTNGQVAEKIGLQSHPTMPSYDLTIVGCGPAGLAAAVYGASEGLRVLVVEREAPGGQAGQSSRIENYLGFPVGLSGADLTRRAVAQAARFGAEILTPQEARSLRLNGSYKLVTLSDGLEVSSGALLISTGVSYRKLMAPGVEELTGSGVYYGASLAEALNVKDGDVFVVGGGNSAGQATLYLARFAKSVTILVRGDSMADSMPRYLIDNLEATPNVRLLTRMEVAEARGADHLEAVSLRQLSSGERGTLPAAGLFVYIGAAPRTEWLGDQLQRDPAGFVVTGADLLREGKPPTGWHLERDPFWLETAVPGIFAAGDVRARSVKRIASAVGEGSMAVQFIHQYLATAA
ncbi:MAG: FAD-dependent oxidoreductase [Chloroflexi bacterium]|nr:FAD-dependent oxidoreductase [Chloroflexota bacterium]MCL5109435.1 FAD-dependent oxidoreductase [Chloroflexota bacterium]